MLTAGLGLLLLGAGVVWFAIDLDADQLHAESFAVQCALALCGLAALAQATVDYFRRRK